MPPVVPQGESRISDHYYTFDQLGVFFFSKIQLLDFFSYELRICSCLACVYRVIDARGKFGEHERCVRVARGDSRMQL